MANKWPPIPKIPAMPTKVDPVPFDVDWLRRLDEVIERDKQFDEWIEELPDMMLAARRDDALRNIIEQAFMLYCLKHKRTSKEAEDE